MRKLDSSTPDGSNPVAPIATGRPSSTQWRTGALLEIAEIASAAKGEIARLEASGQQTRELAAQAERIFRRYLRMSLKRRRMIRGGIAKAAAEEIAGEADRIFCRRLTVAQNTAPHESVLDSAWEHDRRGRVTPPSRSDVDTTKYVGSTQAPRSLAADLKSRSGLFVVISEDASARSWTLKSLTSDLRRKGYIVLDEYRARGLQ